MEYTKKHSGSGFNGMGLAGVLTGGAALLGQAAGGNGLFGNVFGAPRYAPPVAFAEAAAVAGYPYGCCADRHVTEKEICLIRENSGKDAEIAQLRAEKYADAAIRDEVEPLKTRICELETLAAVNASRDRDYRRYVEREFVHQPKVRIRQSLLVCKTCGCCDCDCETAAPEI